MKHDKLNLVKPVLSIWLSSEWLTPNAIFPVSSVIFIAQFLWENIYCIIANYYKHCSKIKLKIFS